MNPLELRKNLLVAESELNRAHLAGDLAALAGGVRALTHRAKSVGSIASTVTVLVAGLSAWHRGKHADDNERIPLFQAILKGAGLIATLWLACRPQDRNQNEEPT